MTDHRGYILLAALFSIFILAVTGCKTSPPSAPVDTPPTVAITSPAQNEVWRLTDTVFVNANDDRGVTKVELYINGSLSGTDETTPFRFIWDTEDWNDGQCVLQAKAYDAAGHSTTSASVTMTIRNAFPATFINTTFTSMSVTVSGVTRTILPNDSSTFALTTNPRNLGFTASTSGKTTTGTVVGVPLSWDYTSSPIAVTSLTSIRIIMQVSSTYFFMYMSNTGATLGPVKVNYGLSDETTDYISIPSDGVKYATGYYKAHIGATVRAYKYPSTTSYVYWTLSSFPSTANQWVWLSNSLSKIATGASGAQIEAGGILQSSSALNDQKKYHAVGPNTIAVFPNE